ncbi:MAG: SdrD B-like domain-containing protein [Anaerolineae bacterium]|jgi:hypothetical protein
MARGKLIVALLAALLVGAVWVQLVWAYEPPRVDGLLDDSYDFYAHFDGDPDGGTAYAPGDVYVYEGEDVCYWALAVPEDFNDNAYSDDMSYLEQFGWQRGHTFVDLAESDGALFNITLDGNIQDVWLDYLNADGSGNYRSGQTGDGWDDPVGCQKDGDPCAYTYVISAATSLYYNLVYTTESGVEDPAFGADPTVQSAPAHWNDPPSSYYWEWQMIYEFTTPKNATGQDEGECPTVVWAGAHNSPTKNDYPMNEERGSIGDYVWLDVPEGGGEADGIQDPEELGVPGITVTLWYYSGTTWVVSGTTQTDANGYYYFTQLLYGQYYVNFELPPSGDYDFTGFQVNGNYSDTNDSDASITGSPIQNPGPGDLGDSPVITLTEDNPYQMYWDAGLVYIGTPTAVRLASFGAGSGIPVRVGAGLAFALLMASGTAMILRRRQTQRAGPQAYS